jgi:hypothetical protein
MDDEVVWIGGPERRTIAIVSYDPSWAERFNYERSRILGALGTLARRIDHIGSTAVPGLAASETPWPEAEVLTRCGRPVSHPPTRRSRS